MLGSVIPLRRCEAPEVDTAAGAEAVPPPLAVVVVSYRAADFILDCVSSLIATGYPELKIVVVDNQSGDGIENVLRGWTLRHGVPFEVRGRRPAALRAPLTLVHSGDNLGFAGGVNVGLAAARLDPGCDLFWVLNPDTTVAPGAPFALARRAVEVGRFAVVGGRVVYTERPDVIQADGGRLHPLFATAVSLNIGRSADMAPPPERAIDYVNGVSMLVSRAFLEAAGPMPERWFLYYEEIDWQLQRGDLPLALAPDAVVYHRAGASIGSAAKHRGAAPLSVYFMCRNLLPFVAKWRPLKLPLAYALAYYKLVRQWGLSRDNLAAALRGLHHLAPPQAVRARLPERIWAQILARR